VKPLLEMVDAEEPLGTLISAADLVLPHSRPSWVGVVRAHGRRVSQQWQAVATV